MTVSGFLSDRLGRFLLAAFFGIWASVFLTLTGTAADIVFLLWLVGAPLFFSVQLYDFVRLRTRLKELAAIMDGLDRKYLFAECVPGAKNEYERRFLEFWVIQSKVGVETGNLEQNVYTDAKWASFILGQLLQNAVRYRRQGSGIRVWAERTGERVCLTLYDNGMGIPSHELPRIFERGFTGSNGRSRGGSTGMGLYLCRKLSDCLELDITVTSKEGEWTKAVVAFPSGCGDVKEEWGGRRYTDNYEGKA